MRHPSHPDGRALAPIRVLITGPVLSDPGGVANYYNAVLPFLERAACEVEYLEIGRRSAGTTFRQAVRDQLRVARRIAASRPDVVHVNPSLNGKSFVRDALFALTAHRRGTRVLVFVRGWDDGFADRIDRWLAWFFRATLGRAAAFVVLAASQERSIRRWGFAGPVHADTTAVADPLLDGFSMTRKLEAMEPEQNVRVLFLARVEVAKGVLDTIDAVVTLAREGLPLTLTVAGDGGAMNLVRERVANDPDAARSVQLAGYVSGAAKAGLLASHHVYCLPSYHGEGLPNSMLEAMAFGMPVITCAAGGIGDMFMDGRMGFLVPPKDPPGIASRLRHLIEHPDLLREIARFNHELAVSKFLASRVAGRLAEVYLSVAALKQEGLREATSR